MQKLHMTKMIILQHLPNEFSTYFSTTCGKPNRHAGNRFFAFEYSKIGI